MMNKNEQLSVIDPTIKVVVGTTTTTAKDVAEMLLRGEATMRQLAHDSFIVELPIQTKEFDLAEYDCWDELHKEIVGAVGSSYEIIGVPHGIEDYVSEGRIKEEVFEWLAHDEPLVILDYALTEGMKLGSALAEAEDYLLGDKDFPVAEFLLEQWAIDHGHDLASVRALTPYIDKEAFLDEKYIVRGKYYIFSTP